MTLRRAAVAQLPLVVVSHGPEAAVGDLELELDRPIKVQAIYRHLARVGDWSGVGLETRKGTEQTDGKKGGEAFHAINAFNYLCARMRRLQQ